MILRAPIVHREVKNIYLLFFVSAGDVRIGNRRFSFILSEYFGGAPDLFWKKLQATKTQSSNRCRVHMGYSLGVFAFFII